MARRKAQTCGVRVRCRMRRAPLGAPISASPRPVRHRASLSVAGISLASSGPTRRTTFRDDAAGRSASSWQGLVVVPGGAPVPPECLTCVAKPAGAAPRPAIKTPLERAPQVDEVVRSVSEMCAPRIKSPLHLVPTRWCRGLPVMSKTTRLAHAPR
jgi:hypothetical protein